MSDGQDAGTAEKATDHRGAILFVVIAAVFLVWLGMFGVVPSLGDIVGWFL